MRLEDLTVHLRARTSWEAMELGMALVRRHAAAIWKPWCLVTLPLFVLVNGLGIALGWELLPALLLWWLKPVYDRIPLYVISRAVFGAVPGTRETVRTQLRWGWKPMLHYLTWRRFSPARSLFLPVDLLEGAQGTRLRERRRVLGGAVYGNAALLTIMCMQFELALWFGGITAFFLFVPPELLPETLKTAWSLLSEETPLWIEVALQIIAWLVLSIVEPFFVGAGFGLYLNRRTQLEAWDVEIVFRKLRKRLAAGSASLLLGFALLFGQGVAPTSALAQQVYPQDESAGEAEITEDDEDEEDGAADPAQAPATLAEVFEDHRVDDAGFRRAVDRAYEDPDFNRTQVQKSWRRRDRDTANDDDHDFNLDWLRGPAEVVAFIARWGVWILAGLLVLALLLTAPRWWPWMRGAIGRAPRYDTEVGSEAIPLPDVLPDDIAAVAQRLWSEGRSREALGLLYRAGVESMSRRLQTTLPPGATEAECLRASRRLPRPEDRQLFARIVRVWQYAAYAQRMPSEADFQLLLDDMRQRGGWLA